MERDVVAVFNAELASIYESRPPISKTKIVEITKAALKAIKFYKHVVFSVEKFLGKCKAEFKIPCLYVIDSILRQSKRQFKEKDVFGPRFAKNFENTLTALLQCPPADRPKIARTLNLWEANGVYTQDKIEEYRKICEANGLETDREVVEKAVKGDHADLSIYEKHGEKEHRSPEKKHHHRSSSEHRKERSLFAPVTPDGPPPESSSVDVDRPSAQSPPMGISEAVLLSIIQGQMFDIGMTMEKDLVLLRQIHEVILGRMKLRIEKEQAANKQVSVKSLLSSNFDYSDEEDVEESEEPKPPPPITQEQLRRTAESLVAEGAMEIRSMHGQRIARLQQAALEAKRAEAERAAAEAMAKQRVREHQEQEAANAAAVHAAHEKTVAAHHAVAAAQAQAQQQHAALFGTPSKPPPGLPPVSLPHAINLAAINPATLAGLLPPGLDSQMLQNLGNIGGLGGLLGNHLHLLGQPPPMGGSQPPPPQLNLQHNPLLAAALRNLNPQLNAQLNPQLTALAAGGGLPGGAGSHGQTDLQMLLSQPPPSLPPQMQLNQLQSQQQQRLPQHGMGSLVMPPPHSQASGQNVMNMGARPGGMQGGMPQGLPPGLISMEGLSSHIQPQDLQGISLPGGMGPGALGQLSQMGQINSHMGGSSIPPQPVPSFSPNRPPPSLLSMDTSVGMQFLQQQEELDRREKEREERDEEGKRDREKGRKRRSRDRDRDDRDKEHDRYRERDRGDRDDRREKKRKHSRSRGGRDRDDDREREKEGGGHREKDRERKKLNLPSHPKAGCTLIASCTVWLGRLPQNVTEEEMKVAIPELNDSSHIQLIGSRACAYVTMRDRKSAVKLLDRSRGIKIGSREIKISWAAGEGAKADKWKPFWEDDRGISLIPHDLLPLDEIREVCVGGWLDTSSLPLHLRGVLNERGFSANGSSGEAADIPFPAEDESFSRVRDNEPQKTSSGDFTPMPQDNVLSQMQLPPPTGSMHGMPPPTGSMHGMPAPSFNPFGPMGGFGGRGPPPIMGMPPPHTHHTQLMGPPPGMGAHPPMMSGPPPPFMNMRGARGGFARGRGEWRGGRGGRGAPYGGGFGDRRGGGPPINHPPGPPPNFGGPPRLSRWSRQEDDSIVSSTTTNDEHEHKEEKPSTASHSDIALPSAVALPLMTKEDNPMGVGDDAMDMEA